MWYILYLPWTVQQRLCHRCARGVVQVHLYLPFFAHVVVSSSSISCSRGCLRVTVSRHLCSNALALK